MKRSWIWGVVFLVLLTLAEFLFYKKLHLSPQIVIFVGFVFCIVAFWLGAEAGEYWFLGKAIPDKILKNNTLFTVERVIGSDYALMRTACPSKKILVAISDKREFDRIKCLFEKEGAFSLVKLRRGDFKTHEWFFASFLTPEKANEQLDGYAVISTENNEVFVAPRGVMHHVKLLLDMR